MNNTTTMNQGLPPEPVPQSAAPVLPPEMPMQAGLPPVEPRRPAAYCRLCGTPVYSTTPQQIAQGLVYCDLHAAQAMPYSAAPYGAMVPPAASGSGQPALAFLLGLLLPGVGAVYNGQYAKGLVHVVIFGLLITILSSGENGPFAPLIAVLLAGFVLYQAFEAYHTAKARRDGHPVTDFQGFGAVDAAPGGTGVLAPAVLIVLGVVFLLANLDVIEFRQLIKFWPVLLIGAGAYRLYVNFQQSRGTRGE